MFVNYWHTMKPEQALRNIKRAGKTMRTLFGGYEVAKEKVLSGEDALFLRDTYAFDLSTILFIAESHGMTVDIEEFEKLLEIEKEKHKNTRLCNAK